mgnify:CR=1 FL=1
MSLVPDDWHDPGSRKGLYYELGWLVVGLGVLLLVAPAILDVSSTPVVPALAGGALLGSGAVYASAEWSAIRRLMAGFWVPFVLIVLGVFVVKPVRRAPTLTVLVTLGAVAAAIPARVAVYWRYRADDGN